MHDSNPLTWFWPSLKGVPRENLPVVKDALGEGLSPRVWSEVSCEAKGLVDGEVGLDDEHRSAYDLRLLKDVTSTTGKDAIDTTNSLLWTLWEERTSDRWIWGVIYIISLALSLSPSLFLWKAHDLGNSLPVSLRGRQAPVGVALLWACRRKVPS